MRQRHRVLSVESITGRKAYPPGAADFNSGRINLRRGSAAEGTKGLHRQQKGGNLARRLPGQRDRRSDHQLRRRLDRSAVLEVGETTDLIPGVLMPRAAKKQTCHQQQDWQRSLQYSHAGARTRWVAFGTALNISRVPRNRQARMILPSTTARRAPVAEGRFDGPAVPGLVGQHGEGDGFLARPRRCRSRPTCGWCVRAGTRPVTPSWRVVRAAAGDDQILDAGLAHSGEARRRRWPR